MSRFRNEVTNELKSLRPRLWLAKLFMLPFPPYVMNRVRTVFIRMAGFDIGDGTIIFDIPTIISGNNHPTPLKIGSHCDIGVQCFMDLAAPISIADYVSIGHQVMFITGTHEIGTTMRRSGDLQPGPITVGEGVWIGARATILPGVTVGHGAVIAAGAMVIRDVPPNTLVAGVPAKVIRELLET